MLKLVQILFVILLLQACQSNKDKEMPRSNGPDLTKAAAFNMQLGLGYLKQGDRPRAKKKLLVALDQQPSSPDINAAMAYYLEQTNEMEQAKKYYLKAISLSSHSGAQLNNYGAFLCRQGDYKNAEIYFLKAVNDQQYIHTSGAYENAGICALAVPDNKKAKIYFSKSLNQDPSRRVALYELAKLESQDGHDLEAFNLLQMHPELVLNDRIFLKFAKKLAQKVGKTDIAMEYESNLNKLEHNIDNSGVNNEYNSNNG